MVWHLLAVLGALALVLEVVAGAVALVAYRKAGGAQLTRDMQTAKRMAAAATPRAKAPTAPR